MMRKPCKVTINNETFRAYRGDRLLDAALRAGIDLPHDCRAGECGSCAVQLVDGRVHCEDGDGGQMLACRCRIVGDCEFVVEEAPPVESVKARVAALMQLAGDIFEMRIETSEPLAYLPGQYVRIEFKGFPERCYSPTLPMDRPGGGNALHLHIRRHPDGVVSGALGRQIRKGYPATVTGPFGSAFLRPEQAGRLVLVSADTGFAPAWSIAMAALAENPKRKMVVIAGGRTLEAVYMTPALHRLADYPNVEVIPTTWTPQNFTKAVRQGRPPEHLQDLTADDVVHAFGPPPMIDEVREIAAAAGATCHAAPFLPQVNGRGEDGLMSRALGWAAEGKDRLLSWAQGWVTGGPARTAPHEPMDIEPDDMPAFRGFREPAPRPRPAPPLRAAAPSRERRPAPPPPPEPWLPEPFPDPWPARQPAAEPWPEPPRPVQQHRPAPPYPRPVETPPPAQPAQLQAPPPRPEPPARPEPQEDAEPEFRPAPAPPRRARPVFVVIPNDSLDLRPRPAPIPFRAPEPDDLVADRPPGDLFRTIAGEPDAIGGVETPAAEEESAADVAAATPLPPEPAEAAAETAADSPTPPEPAPADDEPVFSWPPPGLASLSPAKDDDAADGAPADKPEDNPFVRLAKADFSDGAGQPANANREGPTLRIPPAALYERYS